MERMTPDGGRELVDSHPWLALYVSDASRYVPPLEYERLLKSYVFSGRTDLQLLDQFLSESTGSYGPCPRMLELGPGTGRATSVLLGHLSDQAEVDLVDLSPDMLRVAQQRVGTKGNFTFVQSDSLAYLAETEREYDVVFSLWSFSHAVHQRLIRDGLAAGRAATERILRKFITRNLRQNGRIFVIHVDSCSDEQVILFEQWAKIFEVLRGPLAPGVQSPSKRIIDGTLKALADDGIARWQCVRLKGEPIVYGSVEEALEVLMNFHLETYFNRSPNVGEIIGELTSFLKARQVGGEVRLAPGCFIYSIERLTPAPMTTPGQTRQCQGAVTKRADIG